MKHLKQVQAQLENHEASKEGDNQFLDEKTIEIKEAEQKKLIREVKILESKINEQRLQDKIKKSKDGFNDMMDGANATFPFFKQLVNAAHDAVSKEVANFYKANEQAILTKEKLKELIQKAIDYVKSLNTFKRLNEADKSELLKTVEDKFDELSKDIPEPVIDVPVADVVEDGDGENQTGIRHATTAEIRKKYGLAEYERNNATDEQLEAAANEAIKKGYDPERLIAQMEDLIPPTGVENFILKKYVADLEAEFEKTKSQETLDQIERVVKATDKIGSIQSEAFRTRGGVIPVDDSLAGFFIKEKEINNDAPLTDNQKGVVQKEFDEIAKAKKAFDDYMAKKEDEFAKQQAEVVVKKAKSESKKTNKSHEDYVKEREDIVASMREKLKKARNETNVVILPYAKELIAISPDVLKMVRSYATEGLDKLEFIVDNIHDILKENIPQITKKDINDIIAGEYTEKKKTKNEISKTVQDLKIQAKLVNKLADLQAGIEPKKESEKIKRNQEITNLQNQIKDFVREKNEQAAELSKQEAEINNLKAQLEKEANKPTPEKAALDSLKKKLANQILELEKDLRMGNFDNTPPKPKLKLDKEALALKDELIKKKQQREVRIMQTQYANRNRYQRWRDKALDVLNVPRTIMSSMDFSAPLRQAVIATVTHPTLAAKAGLEMFRQSVSQKRFDRWFHDVKADERYSIMEDSGLYVADPHDPRLTAKEEAFMNNLAEKIPLIGKLIKGSERAYVGYLNKMRVDLFNQFVDEYEAQGKTFDNNPDLYKGLASYINNATGRGKLGVIESAAPVMNAVFFSPRLIASRLNMLNPVYYYKLPKEVRIQALGDIAKFIAFGSTILFLASLANDDEDDEVVMDARSSDFGKMKFGNTRWDIWGGFQQYIRIFTQLMTGESRSANTGILQDLGGEGAFGRTRGDVALSFVRGKLAPIPSMIADILSNRTIMGEKPTILKEAESHLLPLIYSDLKTAMKEKGISALFTVGIPATFGVGVQTYLPREKTIPTSIKIGDKKTEMNDVEQTQFKNIVTQKTIEYKAKLKTKSAYIKADKKGKLDLEKMVSNEAINFGEDYIKKKYPLRFKETDKEKQGRLKKEKDLEKLKQSIGIN